MAILLKLLSISPPTSPAQNGKKKHDPYAVTHDLICQFGGDTRHRAIIIDHHGPQSLTIKSYDKYQKLYHQILEGINRQQVVSHLPCVIEQLNEMPFSSKSTPQEEVNALIKSTGYILYDIKRWRC